MLRAPWYSPEEDIIFTGYADECERKKKEEEEEITLEDLAERYCIPIEEFEQLWDYELSDEEKEELLENFYN